MVHGAEPELIEAVRRAGLDCVEGAFAYRGEGDMTVPGLGHRQRWRLVLGDSDGRRRVLYMKRYGREPLGWMIRRVLTHGRGQSPASVELDNIRRAHEAGVATIDQALADHELDWRGARRSYILLSAVPGEALEQCLEGFLADRGVDSGAAARFTRDLADLVRRFHRAGYVHRDLYTSHVFMDLAAEPPALRLIDLARMFAPRWRRFRWRVKDLAELKYSMPAQWLERHWATFLRRYFEGASQAEAARYAGAIDRKAACIARGAERRRRRRQRRRE